MGRRAGFLSTLGEETRAYQVLLDATVREQLEPIDERTYRDYLVRTLGLDAPLEAAFAYTRGLGSIFELQPRAGYAVQDLLSLGMRPPVIATLPQCTVLPFPDVMSGLGWLYVYERMRLQHPQLCMRVREALPVAHDATNYFCHDNIAVAARWEHFTLTLDALAIPPSQPTIRAAANEAFRLALDWYGSEPLRIAQ